MRVIAGHDALGHLQCEELRRELALLEGQADGGDQARILELDGRQVDADAGGPVRTRLLPRPPMAAGLLQDQIPEGHDQTAVLREGNELGGSQQATLGVRPADQRLHANH